MKPVFTSNRIKLHHSPFYKLALSVRQLLFDVIVIINSITKLSYSAFDNASDL